MGPLALSFSCCWIFAFISSWDAAILKRVSSYVDYEKAVRVAGLFTSSKCSAWSSSSESSAPSKVSSQSDTSRTGCDCVQLVARQQPVGRVISVCLAGQHVLPHASSRDTSPSLIRDTHEKDQYKYTIMTPIWLHRGAWKCLYRAIWDMGQDLDKKIIVQNLHERCSRHSTWHQ